MRILKLIFVLVFTASCGGGGGSSTPAVTPPPPTPDPFGLTTRPTLANFSLPSENVNLGTFTLSARFPNLSFPNALFVAGVPGENRLIVVQQSGEVLGFDNSLNVAATTTILDLANRVLFSGEQGLLGWAFDPAFTQNRFVYVHYSVDNPRRSVIARFTWDAVLDAITIASEKILLEVNQPFANHNGGMLAFGADDYLYIALGDGGSGGDPQNNAQDASNLLGSMLRIDVHPQNAGDPYDIPPDNPFLGQAGVLPEIYAIGLRNPYRFSFDRQTGDLWAGDVGQSTLEEVDLITSGGNYGWRVFEGTQPFDGSLNTLPNSAFTPPVFEYGRSEGVAIIGGYVYRGNQLPSLQGRYVYSDFGSGSVWALEWDGANVVNNDLIATASSPTSFGEDNQGELLLVSRQNGIFGFDLNGGGGGGGNLPDQLSETGLFTDLSQLTVASGLIEYEVNHRLWSDGTSKRSWIAVPGPDQIVFDDTAAWNFPTGAVIVKHFEIELTEGDPTTTRRLETRLLINTSDGWQGFTYRWNVAETDATLLTSRETETLTITLASGGTQDQTYEYPSRTDCLQCHTQVAGSVLGVRARQINRDFVYPSVSDNQLRSWNNIQLFTTNIGDASQYGRLPALDDASATVVERARAYLQVNCAHCHQPSGPTTVDLDLRFDTADGNMNAIGQLPTAGDLGIANAEIIAAGAKERSVLWARLQALDGDRMPPLASHRIDSEAVVVVGDWIDNL